MDQMIKFGVPGLEIMTGKRIDIAMPTRDDLDALGSRLYSLLVHAPVGDALAVVGPMLTPSGEEAF